jgi:hypothetical protein
MTRPKFETLKYRLLIGGYLQKNLPDWSNLNLIGIQNYYSE